MGAQSERIYLINDEYTNQLTTDIRGDPYTAIVNPLATKPR